MSDFDEHTRMWADEIVDRCYHDSHTGVGEDLWKCDECGEVIRYIDDPEGNVTLTGLHPHHRSRRVRVEMVTPGTRPWQDPCECDSHTGVGEDLWKCDFDEHTRMWADEIVDRCDHAWYPWGHAWSHVPLPGAGRCASRCV